MTTYRAKDGATAGQATTLTGFLTTNRFRGEKKDVKMTDRKGESLVWNRAAIFFFFFKFSLHGGGSPQAALHRHHTQQVKRLTLDNSHHVCLLRLSGLRAADVQKKVKWFIVTWGTITQKEQPNITQEFELQLSESKGSAKDTNKHQTALWSLIWNAHSYLLFKKEKKTEKENLIFVCWCTFRSVSGQSRQRSELARSLALGIRHSDSSQRDRRRWRNGSGKK